MTQEDHVFEWLTAYVDGELSGVHLHKVEDHLRGCEVCQVELATLQRLSVLLQEAPPATSRVSAGQFIDQIRLRLPPQSKPERPTWTKALQLGWQLVPLGLLVAWVCLQAFFWIGQASLLALNVPADLLLGALRVDRLGNLSDLMASSLFGSRFLIGLGLLWLINIYLTVMIAIFFWGWLASWWVTRRAGE